ncbi:hypothetical protein C8Q73DRAFT_789851 [Cubamyces lactineus]|nr:hypothetical protein C8Q73DRAFT_789851 [Cubamyces lactineus]
MLRTATIFIAPFSGGGTFSGPNAQGNAIWFTSFIKFVRYFSEQGSTGGVAGEKPEDVSHASVAKLFGYASVIIVSATISHTAGELYSIVLLACSRTGTSP